MIAAGKKIDLALRVKLRRDGVAKEVTLAELLTRPTVVSVFMKANTGTCDRQMDSLRSAAAEVDRAGFNLVAVSRDTCGVQERYATAKSLPFVLASDPTDEFARAADALVEKSMYGRSFTGPARSAFVLDRDGTVLAVVPKIDAATHGTDIVAVLKELAR